MKNDCAADFGISPAELDFDDPEPRDARMTLWRLKREHGVPSDGADIMMINYTIQLTVRVRDQTGEETFFKLSYGTRMQKLFETYARRKGLNSSSLRFLLDGERINGDSTSRRLELRDQDQIDCPLEQQGD